MVQKLVTTEQYETLHEVVQWKKSDDEYFIQLKKSRGSTSNEIWHYQFIKKFLNFFNNSPETLKAAAKFWCGLDFRQYFSNVKLRGDELFTRCWIEAMMDFFPTNGASLFDVTHKSQLKWKIID